MNTGQVFGFAAGALVIAAGVGAAIYFVDIDQTQQASLPNVNVDVEGGQMPQFDVETGSVEVGTSQQTIEVPEVDIRTTERTIEVPTIDVEPAPAN